METTKKENKKNGNKKKKQQKDKKNVEKQNKRNGAAPRRGRYNKKNIKSGTLKPLKDFSSVSVRENIMVIAKVEPKSIEALPLAIIARGILFGQNTVGSPIYWAYYAFMKDIIAIMNNEISPVTNRLAYVSQIIQSWLPKTAPFKTGTLSYSWDNVSAIQIPNDIVVRGFHTWLFVPDGSTFGPWNVYAAPASFSAEGEAFSKLSDVYTVIANHREPTLRYEYKPIDSEYKSDTSAYVAVSGYYGNGSINEVGPSFSIENEVPFKSNLLGGSTVYEETAGRVARCFNLASGDTTCAFGYPFMPGFKQEYYKTAYPPQFKFLDLDEVVTTLAVYYTKLVAAAISVGNGKASAQTAFAYTPFSCSAQQFRIAVRQAVLSFFAASAPLSQFQQYATDSNGFEAFRCGTNSMPVNIQEMRMPSILVENLRMLLPAYGFLTTNYQNPKNALMMIPVWGLYRSVVDDPPNPTGTFYSDYQGEFISSFSLLFTGGSGSDPNPIDGSGTSGECLDLNSPVVNSIIQEWNVRLNILSAYSTPLSFLTGTSATTLLTLNRYCEYKSFEVPLTKIPPYLQLDLNPTHIKKVKRESSSKKTKLNVKGTPVADDGFEDIYVPSDFSLATQVTRGIASMQSITEALKTLVQYFILPSIAITPGTPPDQRAVRVQNLESEIWDLSTSSQDFSSSRETQLIAYASLMAPGIATGGTADELVSIIKHLNDTNQGGFLGDILTGVASVLLPMIPI